MDLLETKATQVLSNINNYDQARGTKAGDVFPIVNYQLLKQQSKSTNLSALQMQ
jgi:hypothetical protein